MQLTGDRFTQETASFGNDLSTFPNFPAEIRAPAGTLPGVSSFQLHFADHDILTPGDAPNVLVAMNPAALMANIGDLPRGADLIVNIDEFTKRNLAKVGYATVGFLEQKFAKKPEIMKANIAAFRAGWNYGETTEAFSVSYEVKPAKLESGHYRNITGNMALAYGLIAASRQSGLPLFLGSYPITPASDILHELSKHKRFGVRTFQAEDEIAGVGAALGASFGGALGVTTTSGPGMTLKSETIGLGVAVELPLIVCDIQRAGPSTDMPTKTEQADLLQALYGRNGEAPVPVIAPQSPNDCFTSAIEAARIAVKYRTPVILLSDGYLANGSEPWQIPDVATLPKIDPGFPTKKTAESADEADEAFEPFKRDPNTLARPWAVPGTPGLEHRIGGLEKADGTGNISNDPNNHDLMVRLRQAKIDGIANDIPPLEPDDPRGPDGTGAKVLVLGWGSTYGAIAAAVRRGGEVGGPGGRGHLRYLNPFPANIAEVLKSYDRVLVPEINLGQLALLIKGKFLIDVISYNRVRGFPFKAEELAGVIQDVIDSE